MGNCCAVAVPPEEIAEKETKLAADEEEEEEDDDDDYVDEIPDAPMKSAGPRSSVSAEAYGAWNKKGAFNAPKYPKDAAQKGRIKKALLSAFMFSALDDKDMEVVIEAFKEEKKGPGDEIIKQFDEDAASLFLIEKGTLAVHKRKDKNEAHPGPQVFTYQDSGVFGELALLYNCPRAATVIAKTDCLLWSIDRETFNHLVKDAASRKREMHQSFLGSVEILKSLDPYERSKIADALRSKTYNAGEVLIKQGDPGSEFFILEEGSAVALKDGKEVMQYGTRDVFGELALIKDQPRAATVTAKSTCRCLTLERSAFKRLLGPLDAILATRAKTLYEKVK